VANLQPYSSFETGATIPNGSACTLSFDTAHFQANTRALKVVTTAAGTGWIETFGVAGNAYDAAVTAGSTYTTSAYIYASSASSSVRIDANYQNASHVNVNFGAGSWVTPTQNAWTRLVFTGVIPSGTAYVATAFEWQSPTPSGAVFWFDAMQVETGSSATAWSPGPNDPTGAANLWQYGSFESGPVLDDVSLCTTAFSSAQAWVGTRSVATTISGTPGSAWAGRTSAGNTTYLTSVTQGSTYTASIYVRTSASSNSLTCLLSWLDGSGNWVADSTTTFSQVSANTWTRLTCTGVAQSTFAGIWLQAQSPTANGTVIYTDGWQLETGSTATAWVPGPNDPTGTLPAPTNLHTTAVAATTISLAWNAVVSAAGYELVVALAGSLTVPGVPTGVTATAGDGQAVVSWTAPSSNGGSAIIDYTVTSTPGSFTATTSSLSATVTGLTNGTAYTFRVTARNSVGSSSASAASAAVTPSAGALAKQGFSPGGPFMSLSSTDRTSDITAMVSMNGKWARIDYGGGDPSFFTSVADELASHSIQTLAVITGADTSAFQSLCNTFALAAIDHGVRVFELWNEANIGTGGVTDATDYTNRILKPGYTGIKAAAVTRGVTVTVLMTGMAPGGGSQDPITFLTAIYAAGGGGYFDAGNMHPYTWPDLPTAGDASWNTFLKTQGFHDVMNAHGNGAMKVWATEVGWPTGGGTGSVTEATQASMATTFCSNWYSYYPSFAGPMFWYSVRDYGQSGTEGYFGLTRQDFSHKPAFATLATAYAGM
jgi:hypothetical protein